MTSRWADQDDEALVLKRFKIAFAAGLRERFGGEGAHYDDALEQRFSVVHGTPFGAISGIRAVILAAASRREIAHVIDDLLTAARDTPVPHGAWGSYLEDVSGVVNDILTHHPAITLKLVKIGEAYEIQPVGAPELDTTLVTSGVEWLTKYPAVQAEARRSLRALADGDDTQCLNAAREALEMLAKAVAGNDRSLENQIGRTDSSDAPLLKWLREQGVKPQVITMARQTISSLCQFQNEWVKHRPATGVSFTGAEVEHVIYATFLLIRLISQSAA